MEEYSNNSFQEISKDQISSPLNIADQSDTLYDIIHDFLIKSGLFETLDMLHVK